MPTCLVHNCETSQRFYYFHLLSPLFCDQFPLIPISDIVNVVVVVSIIVFQILLDGLLRLSCRKMLKDRSLKVEGRGKYNGSTGRESVSEEDLFIAFLRSRTTLILWGLSEKMFQECHLVEVRPMMKVEGSSLQNRFG